MKLSVMIPIRNEADFIYQTLSQCADQSLARQDYELMVVDGESDDATVAEVQRFARDYPDVHLTLLNNPKRRSSAARNLAVTHGQGDYLLLIDGHVYIPSQTLFHDMLRCAETTQAKVLGRPQPQTPPGVTEFQERVAICRGSSLAHSGESYIYSDYEGWVSPLSVAIMYHRSVFDEVGLFDDNFDASEDVELNYRLEQAGYECYISPAFTVFYYPRSSLPSLFKQLTRYGEGRARFLNKHPERFSIETIIPAVFFGLVLIGLLFSLVIPFIRGLFLLGLFAYAIIVMSELKFKQNVSDWQTLLWGVPIIFTIHCGLGYGYLKERYQLWRQQTSA